MGITLKKYIWMISLVFVLILSYILAKTSALLLSGYFPSDDLGPLVSSGASSFFKNQKAIPVESVIQRNIFDATDSTFNTNTQTEPTLEIPDAETVVQTDGVAVKTSLAVTLVSTISFGNGEDNLSSCVLASGPNPEVYGVGDNMSFPQTQIVRILPKRVEFSNKGRLEYVEILDEEKSVKLTAVEVTSEDTVTEETKPDEEVAEVATDEEVGEGVVQDGNHFKVKAALVQEAMSQPDKLYSQIRAIPHQENGKNAGFRFFKVSPKSIFQQLGIRRGDIVKSVNGKTLDMQSGIQTFAELKNLKNFEIELVRKGASQKFTYEVVD